MEKDKLYIKHILDAISAIEQFTQNVEFEGFIENKLLQDGIARELEIIGEASKKLSPDFKSLHNDLPWQDIAGMRDKLIHEYFGVDLVVVWETVKQDLPSLNKRFKTFNS